MNELLVLLVVGALLTLGFLATLLKGPQGLTPKPESFPELIDLVCLPGLSFQSAHRLFESSDYDLLKGSPQLEPVAQQFWRDRRRLVLHWLRLLENDVHALWRFRRMLARYGVSKGFTSEATIAAQGLSTLAMLLVLRLVVALTGPFALVAVLRYVFTRVKEICRSCEDLWHTAPPHLAARLTQEWAGQSMIQ